MRRIVPALEETQSPLTAVALAAVHAEVFASGWLQVDGAEQPESDYRGIADHQRNRQREPSGWRLPVLGEGYRSL